MIVQSTIEQFVEGWVICRRVPNTRIHKESAFIHVRFGEHVGGRTDEIFINEAAPETLKQVEQYMNEQQKYWLTVFSEGEPLNLSQHLYRVSETLMVNELIEPLDKITAAAGTEVKLIDDEAEALELNAYFNAAIADPRRIKDTDIEDYAVYVNGQPAGNGRISFNPAEGVACMDNIYVDAAYRGNGLGKVLCSTLLHRAQPLSKRCILASSDMGYPLYKKLGFEPICNMHVYEQAGS
ncbi:GNAT family N-acetyltransferase [Paenibacillus sp. MER TA 81-3]|uniref:GNAT family N-acetyltransferase n=1 Tax=Paenibacillus sp. MER TA 81-3 TaxID=2939573 RepID=UPI00203EE22D|nr:GNAT family N-acetyltransferase [Paenibacillus sp. MER TA 81-3]MCM3341107.1 GNAT family N-acetyltransferase [Paenibacillus sp. MER TA 81-3]